MNILLLGATALILYPPCHSFNLNQAHSDKYLPHVTHHFPVSANLTMLLAADHSHANRLKHRDAKNSKLSENNQVGGRNDQPGYAV
ncbi:hypothetical protein [Grimontia sp. NTOU-MAR1]|uniref:hypothetical protein n=1 Tax=Grimontia sp. NTOU-MAR1 TaxID=3111011 RepID=UPI002DC06092|nr:hypothetical protein [Grimontia sp. NTOU-MAR1]WRW00026.1 hypothetical protein VP504_23885 [Grimontia sp. NTOU-MAR1]